MRKDFVLHEEILFSYTALCICELACLFNHVHTVLGKRIILTMKLQVSFVLVI